MKIIALCCFRNVGQHIGEFLRSIEPYVDEIMLLDDRSMVSEARDARTMVEAYHPKVTALFSRASRMGRTGEPFAFETRNRRILLREALAEGATHVLCLDADERMELAFFRELPDIAAANICMWAQVRDLWDNTYEYRVDGVWAHKQKPIFFPRVVVEDSLSINPSDGLHQSWMGHLISERLNKMCRCDYNLYHLGSLTRGMRAERVAKHNAADPTHQWQADYNYLADETGLKVEGIPEGKEWR